MNRTIFIIGGIGAIILVWMYFGLSRYLPAELIFNRGIKYESNEVQQKLANELKNRNIPYHIDREGIIHYRKKDEKIVKKIGSEISLEHAGYRPIPPELDNMLDKGNNLILQSKYDKALELLDQAVSKYPDYSIVYNWRGMVWGMKGEDDNAVANYSMAIELNPKEHSSYTNRAMVWLRKNEYEKAIQDFNTSIKLFPNDGQSHFYRGLAFSKIKNFHNALNDYYVAIKLDTKWAEGSFKTDQKVDPIYLFALAEHFAKSTNFENAIQIQERAIELLLEENAPLNLEDFRKRLECYKVHKICRLNES